MLGDQHHSRSRVDALETMLDHFLGDRAGEGDLSVLTTSCGQPGPMCGTDHPTTDRVGDPRAQSVPGSWHELGDGPQVGWNRKPDRHPR